MNCSAALLPPASPELTTIKITHARQVEGFIVELRFSDGSVGECNLGPIVQRDTVLTRPLVDMTFFRFFFLELGALAWTNGFELSGDALHKELEEKGTLHSLPRLSHCS